MKRFWFAAALVIALGILCYSCGGKESKTTTSSMTELTDESTEMEANTIEDVDDGDPNIKAASVDKMKMVVDSRGNVVGRYVRTNQTTYTVSVQDDVEVPKLGHKIVEYSARNGQGIVYTLRTNVNVRTQPDLKSSIICQITTKAGEMPKTYPCLGKAQGWYKIRIRGTEGYVRHDLVIWDGMDTF